MKLFILLLSFLSTANADINKCVVDGKTLYQQAPCPTDESQRTISDKTFTKSLSLAGVRAAIAKNQDAKDTEEKENNTSDEERAARDKRDMINHKILMQKANIQRIDN